MERMRRKIRNLAAFCLCVTLFVQNGLTALAAGYEYNKNGNKTISSGMTIYPGDTIKSNDSRLVLYCNGLEETGEGSGIDNNDYKTTYKNFIIRRPQNAGHDRWLVQRIGDEAPMSNGTFCFGIYLISTKEEEERQNVGDGHTHTHTLSWEVTKEPTPTEDGLTEYGCECGYVEARQPISGMVAFLRMVIDRIKNAPQKACVEVSAEIWTCYNDTVMDALAQRSDVSLLTKFVSGGERHSFLIPAGAASQLQERTFLFREGSVVAELYDQTQTLAIAGLKGNKDAGEEEAETEDQLYDPAPERKRIRAADIEAGTLVIGTHLIHLSALTDELYEIAMQSAVGTNNEIYYKHENGSWYLISTVSSVEDILTAGIPVDASVIEALLITQHTKSDGVTYDLRSEQPVNQIDLPDTYDSEYAGEETAVLEEGKHADEEDPENKPQNYYGFLRLLDLYGEAAVAPDNP